MDPPSNEINAEDVLNTWLIPNYPYTGVPIALAYLYFVKVIGPNFMKDRPAFTHELKPFLRIYNLFQIYINCYMVYHAIDSTIISFYFQNHCKPDLTKIDFNIFIKIATLAWIYICVKVLDLMDTVFIILKKKDNQLSFLHLFHHSMVVVLAMISFAEKECLGFPIFILNSFVHSVMYTYYFLASFKRFKKLLWWKVYITRLQISQFIAILLYLIYAIANGCHLGYRMKFAWLFVVSVLLVLFTKFYVETYWSKREKKK